MESLNPYKHMQTIKGNSAEDIVRMIKMVDTPMKIHHMFQDKMGRFICFFSADVKFKKKEVAQKTKVTEPTKTNVIKES